MKERKLILLDLDGTTLYDWETITDETIDTVKKVKDLGHIVAIATGRPYRSSKVYYDALELNTPIINYNGALIHHPYNESFATQTNVIELSAIYQIFADLNEYIENAFCEFYEDIYLHKMNDSILPLIHPEGGNIIVGDFTDTLKINPNGFILLAYPNKHQIIEDYIRKNFNGVLNSRNWGGEYEQVIEIFSPSTCKGIAMNYIANYFNIPNQDIIAFGDGTNDIEMIKNAGLGVAMDNAHILVKNVAKDFTLKNTEDGVAYYLKKYFNL